MSRESRPLRGSRSSFATYSPTSIPKAELRDFENIPLAEDIDAYFDRELRSHASDAWMDRGKEKIGYAINFNYYFYKYTPPRPLEETDADLKKKEETIVRLSGEVTT